MKKILSWVTENVLKKAQFRVKLNGDDVYVTIKFYGFVIIDKGFDLKKDGFQPFDD